MAKPNQKQIAVIRMLRQQTNFWEGTNDIHSPTHHSDNDETVNNVEGLTTKQTEELSGLIDDLFFFIRNLKV